jgi:hypothetical protein
MKAYYIDLENKKLLGTYDNVEEMQEHYIVRNINGYLGRVYKTSDSEMFLPYLPKYLLEEGQITEEPSIEDVPTETSVEHPDVIDITDTETTDTIE